MFSFLRSSSNAVSRAVTFNVKHNTGSAFHIRAISTSNSLGVSASKGHDPAVAQDRGTTSTVNASFSSENDKNTSTNPQSSGRQGDVNKDASPDKNTVAEPTEGKPADHSAPMASNPGNSNDGKEFSARQDEVDSGAKPERNK